MALHELRDYLGIFEAVLVNTLVLGGLHRRHVSR